MAKLIIAAALFAASVVPANAQYHCYSYQGQLVCCTTVGNNTICS